MDDPVIRDARQEDAPGISELVRRTVRTSNVRDYPAKAVELTGEGR